jgi:NAD(P)-dependent dehydrogenase (short-subunit alcohol dehydrogenase family)
MDLHLTGKKILVTGGTQGIGRAIVEEFLIEGAHVAFCARNPKSVSDSAAHWQKAGHRVSGTAVDVRNETALRAWVRQSAHDLGGIDCLVSNVSAASGDWRAMFETDLLAAVHLADEARPFLEKSKAASVVAISSRAAYTGTGPYGAMKCALMSYMKTLSDDWAPKGIRCNVVSPGDIFFAGGVWDKIKRERPDIWAEAQIRNASAPRKKSPASSSSSPAPPPAS